MNIEFEYNKADDCCYVQVSGRVHTADVQKSFDDAWATTDYTDAGRALWDFSTAQIRLSPEERDMIEKLMAGERNAARSRAGINAARGLADYAIRGRPEKLPAKVAMIAGSDLDMGMMRIYLGYAAFDDFEARVFRTEDKARAWLFE